MKVGRSRLHERASLADVAKGALHGIGEMNKTGLATLAHAKGHVVRHRPLRVLERLLSTRLVFVPIFWTPFWGPHVLLLDVLRRLANTAACLLVELC